MSIQELLDYQELDMQIIKLEKDFISSEDYRKYEAYSKQFNYAKKALQSMEESAIKIMASSSIDTNKLNNLIKEADDIANVMKDAVEPSEVDYHISALNKIYKEINTQEALIKETIDKSEELVNKSKEKHIELSKLHQLATKFKQLALEKKKELDEKTTQIAKKRDMLVKKIDESLFIAYKKARENTKIAPPPFVVKVNGDFCGGCSVEIDMSKMNILKSQGVIICSECNRIIYNN